MPVKNVLSKANKKISVALAAGLLSASYLVSSLMGLLIKRLLSAKFDPETLDAYFAAFALPDLMFSVLVAGALSVVLVPMITERVFNNRQASAWKLSSNVISFLALTTGVTGVLLIIFADPLVSLIFAGFGDERHRMAVDLMRIFSISPALFAISATFASIQQAFGRFFFFAVAPLIYNAGILIGIYTLAPELGIYGVALGVVIGALLQLLIQSLGLLGLGYRYGAHLQWRSHSFRQFLRLLVPRSIDQGADQINSVVEKSIASHLAAGSIFAYQYALDLKNVPITLIGVAIATAIFPRFSVQAASNRTDVFRRQIRDITQILLWLALPAALSAFFLRGYLARLLVGRPDQTVSDILIWFTIAIVFQSLLLVISRAFYARQDTKTPLYTSLVAIGANIILAISLVTLLDMGVQGLAIAQSVVAVAEVLMLVVILTRQLGVIWDVQFFGRLLKTVVALAGMALAMRIMVTYFFPLLAGESGFWSLTPKFGGIVFASFSVYLLMSYWLALEPAQIIVGKAQKLLTKRVRTS